MTIKNTLRSIAVILLLALIAHSCIEIDNATGSQLLPSNHMLSVNKATFDLPVQMKVADSMQTGTPDYLLVGSFRDADLGEVRVSTAVIPIPTTTGLNYGESPIIRSFIMHINVDSNTYFKEEDQVIPQNFKIHKIVKDIDSSTVYNNSITDDFIDPNAINLGGNIYFGGDSLEVELSHEYALELLSATELERDSLDYFIDRFKGIYITTEPTPTSLEGGRISLIHPSSIYFTLTYRHLDIENSIDKDSTITYYVDENAPNLNRFTHESAFLEDENPQDKIFMEGLAGIKPYIEFSHVKEDITAWAQVNDIDLNKLIIAKAELILPFEYPNNLDLLNYFPSQIFINTRVERSDRIIYYPIEDISSVSDNGYINRSHRHYSIEISTYLQRVLQGRFTGRDLGAYIAPIYQSSDAYTGTVYYYLQSYLYSKAVLNGNGSERNPQLILSYSLLP